MSSLSVNGLQQRLGNLFSGVSAASAAAPTSRAGGTASSTGPTAPATPAATPQVGGHHRRHGGGGGKPVQQIQDAVTSALQAAKATGGTSNPDKVIEDAIAKVFKQTSAISSASSTSSSTGQAAGSDPDSDGDTDAAGATDTDTASQQAFFQTLQSLGVSPQQFRSDFLGAIQDAQQTGNIDVAAALKSLPKGTTLDTFG